MTAKAILEQCKNEVAKKEGYIDWNDFHQDWESLGPSKPPIFERLEKASLLASAEAINELKGELIEKLLKEATMFENDGGTFAGGLRYGARLIEIHGTIDDRS